MINYHGGDSWVSLKDPEVAEETYLNNNSRSYERLWEDVYREFNDPAGSPSLAREVFKELAEELTEEKVLEGKRIAEEKTPSVFVDGWS